MVGAWMAVGLPVLGKQQDCKTVFVLGERRVDKTD